MLRPNAYNTLEGLNLNLLDEIWFDGRTGMPTLMACGVVPERLVPFHGARRRENTECGVHFYIEDYEFTNLWRQPERYINILSRFDCVVSPDFSTYFDMPAPMARWQIYRRRLLSQWMQRTGLNVIYNVQTMREEYDDDQLSGVDGGGTVSVRLPLNFSRNGEGRNEFYRILEAIRERLSPETVMVYGKVVPLPSGMNYKFYENDNIRVRRSLASGKGEVLA